MEVESLKVMVDELSPALLHLLPALLLLLLLLHHLRQPRLPKLAKSCFPSSVFKLGCKGTKFVHNGD